MRKPVFLHLSVYMSPGIIIIYVQSILGTILLFYGIACIDGKHGISENLATGLFGASFGMLFTALLFCKILTIFNNMILKEVFTCVFSTKIASSVVLISYGLIVLYCTNYEFSKFTGSLILGMGISIFVGAIIYSILYRLQLQNIERLKIMNV